MHSVIPKTEDRNNKNPSDGINNSNSKCLIYTRFVQNIKCVDNVFDREIIRQYLLTSKCARRSNFNTFLLMAREKLSFGKFIQMLWLFTNFYE